MNLQSGAENAELSDNQKKKIELYMRDDASLMRAVSNLVRRTRSSTAIMLRKGSVDQKMKKIDEIITSILGKKKRNDLEDLICKKLEYCKRELTVAAVITIITGIVGFSFALTGVVSALVLLIKQNWVSVFLCRCNQPTSS